MASEVRTMKFLGIDNWDRPVYQCVETGVLWKDITLGSENPELYSCQNSFDGEPDCPIKSNLEIHFENQYSEDVNKFNYMMLSRLKGDCEYYLLHGNKNKKHLYYPDEQKHIDEMKMIHRNFADDEKPEWLTYDQILAYEKAMVAKLNAHGEHKSL